MSESYPSISSKPVRLGRARNNPDLPTLALLEAATKLSDKNYRSIISVPGIHCAGCIQTIEVTLANLPGVSNARVNLTHHLVQVDWDASAKPPPIIESLRLSGFEAQLAESDAIAPEHSELKEHIKALAVAGFAAGNIMMLSWSIWAGADSNTVQIFHIISAIIAIPALIYSGRIFFASAWHALRVGKSNMDVPITVGIVLTALLSLYDTVNSGAQHVYFDAVMMLIFFLLIGRTLDVRMRAKARDAVSSLRQLQPTVALQLLPDGSTRAIPAINIVVGDQLVIRLNDRLPVNSKVETGESYIDMTLVSGESTPVLVIKDSVIPSGCINTGQDIVVIAQADVNHSFLAEVEDLIVGVNDQKGRYALIADRVAKYYSPVVHLAALLSFILWIWLTGSWHSAITIGVSVLIITCPCALGLAVPITRVIAAHRLFKQGILMRDGAALERLASVNTVVFDKTGTLTTSEVNLVKHASANISNTLLLANYLCKHSSHPHAQAILNISETPHNELNETQYFEHITEHPGLGIEAKKGDDLYRLGQPDWAVFASSGYTTSCKNAPLIDRSYSTLSKNGSELAEFEFGDTLKSDAISCITRLKEQSLTSDILSGDSEQLVSRIANTLNIENYQSRCTPSDKLDVIQAKEQASNRVLMIGDGVNDSPAFAAATVSMSPSAAADITRKMADFVLLQNRLNAIPESIDIARNAQRIVKQNLSLALGYNLAALPLAVTGNVTPLIAAIAMSLSSALVIANSLRLALTNNSTT